MTRKIFWVIVMLAIQGASIFAFEFDMLNLNVPSQRAKGDLVLNINHRFYGQINGEPLNGANVGLGLSYAALPGIEITGSYSRYQNEYIVGAGYKFLDTPMLKSQVDISYFDYKDSGFNSRSNNTFYRLSLNTGPVWNGFVPVLNAGYDGYNQRTGYGVGLSFGFNPGISTIQHINIIGEYYPVVAKEAGITGPENSFCFGVGFDTYGHNFALFAGNNTEIGDRRLMLGAPDNRIRFGFNITRKF